MEQEITETYTFHPDDYRDGQRKVDGKTFREVVKTFERDFHHRHSSDYALNLYANAATMRLLEKSCGAAPFLSYGMDLTKGMRSTRSKTLPSTMSWKHTAETSPSTA